MKRGCDDFWKAIEWEAESRCFISAHKYNKVFF